MCSCMLASSCPAIFIAVGGALQRFQIAQCKSSVLEQIRNEQPGRAAEQIEQVAHKPAAVLALIDRRLKELGVADLFYSSQRTFFFEAIDERLDGGVRDTFVFGETLEGFAHGCNAKLPELLEDTSFGFGEARRFHAGSYGLRQCYYIWRCISEC